MAEPHRPRRFETRDVPARWPLLVGLAVLALLAGVLAGVAALAPGGAHVREPRFFALPLNDRDAPVLRADAGSDLARMRAIGEQGLHGYGWIDRDAGVLHIPVERAMTLYLERHAARPTGDTDE